MAVRVSEPACCTGLPHVSLRNTRPALHNAHHPGSACAPVHTGREACAERNSTDPHVGVAAHGAPAQQQATSTLLGSQAASVYSLTAQTAVKKGTHATCNHPCRSLHAAELWISGAATLHTGQCMCCTVYTATVSQTDNPSTVNAKHQ